MIEKEDEAKKLDAIERRAANAPAPGAKPKRPAKNAPSDGNGSAAVPGGDEGDPTPAERAQAGSGKTGETPSNSNPAGRTPRPGAKPKKRRR
jgi:YidC/Oxa1 family membrane protein insertase